MKRRYNIGLVVGNVEDEFSNSICKGAMRAAELLDDNLFIIPAKYLGRVEGSEDDPAQKYEYQFNFLIQYAQKAKLDLVLVAISTIGYRVSVEEKNKIIKLFGDTPVILIADTIPGYASVKYDNRLGLLKGINYLIEKRNCSHICMFSGSLGISDSKERYETFVEALNAHDITFDEKRIAYSDISGFILSQVEQLILDNPDMDALVCTNDKMAWGAYSVLEKYKYRIGRDVCVLGFDDLEESADLNPPLATVKADAVALGHKGMMEAHNILEKYGSTKTGEELVKILADKVFYVETTFILRESASGEQSRKKEVSENVAAEYAERIKHLIDMNHQMNKVNLNMLTYGTVDSKEFGGFMEAMGDIDNISACFLYTFNKPIVNTYTKMAKLPEYLFLRTMKNGKEVTEIPKNRQRISVTDVFTNSFYPEERNTYVVIDVFSREKQYGILICNIPYEDFHYVEVICFQIGIAIKIRNLFDKQKELLIERGDMLEKLEKENILLDDISNKDELTGVYNRRGFMTRVEAALKDESNFGRKGMVIYTDLNYLKQINDKYSHAEGNFAIKACAEALEENVGNKGKVGRIGGDEFVAFAFLDEVKSGQAVKERIKAYFDNLNSISGKKYEVRTSVGYQEFIIGEGIDLKQELAKADEYLYADKAVKPPFAG